MMRIEEKMCSIDDFMNGSDECYAHCATSGKEKETLREHTEKCQRYWKQIVNEKDLNDVFAEFERVYLKGFGDYAIDMFEQMTANIITLHDVGKVNPSFQKSKMLHTWHLDYMPDTQIGSKHSIISAVFYLSYYLSMIKEDNKTQKLNMVETIVLKNIVYIYAYIISRHHGSLNEFEKFVHNVADTDADRDSESLGVKAREWVKTWEIEVDGKENFKDPTIQWKRLAFQLRKTNEEDLQKSIYLYGLTRLLYSLLVTSDYYATTEFMCGFTMEEFGNLKDMEMIMDVYDNSSIQKSIRLYEQTDYPMGSKGWLEEKDINVLRSELFLDAEKSLEDNMNESIYYLEAPTGSGKSNTAMNLCFKFIQNDPKIKKIFYIYPYNTLVEQNLESINRIFGSNEKIMSQISVVNSLAALKSNEENETWNEILLDRQFLNYPIVLSTHVMLFRTLFGNSKEDAFAFHQINHSVIVLDEIQSYSNSLWSEMIIFFKSFAQLFHLKFIIMSATLPNLELLIDDSNGTVSLTKDREKYFNHPKFAKRVIFNYDLLEKTITLDDLVEHIQAHTSQNDNILIEFIKKSTAEEFYRLLKQSIDKKVYLITGDSSIQDRKRIIQTVEEEEGVILVATQTLEAGVDMKNMDIGYKDISKLDSEEQFAGRICRSGKKQGVIYFFNFDDAKKIYGADDVRTDEENTILNKEVRKILETKNFPKFYEERVLSSLKKKKSKANNDNLQNFFTEHVGFLDMPSVNQKMKLINDERQIKNAYLGRIIQDVDGEKTDGRVLWEAYKALLQNNEMDYAEKKVRLHNIRTQMNNFIYQVSAKAAFQEDEQIGDLYYIENGEAYFDENGVFMRESFENGIDLFI